MKFTIECTTAEEALIASRTLTFLSLALSGEVTFSDTGGDSPAEDTADNAPPKRGRGRPRKEKPDAAEAYNDLATAAAEPVVLPEETPEVDLDALLAPAPPSALTRDELIARLNPVIAAKGAVWAKEHVIQKYEIKRLSELSDENLAELYAAHCD